MFSAVFTTEVLKNAFIFVVASLVFVLDLKYLNL